MSSNKCDAQLALIRLAIRAVGDPRARHELEQARFGLYEAIEAEDATIARAWLRTLRLGVRAVPSWADAEVAAALEEIEAVL